jgi:hypothetical protein
MVLKEYRTIHTSKLELGLNLMKNSKRLQTAEIAFFFVVVVAVP